jgi:hypothetical protein
MKLSRTWGAALILVAGASLAGASLALAAELKSGIQKGEQLPAFDVRKCAGSEDDNVAIGDKLCYRCKYGARPMVMVFTRKSDETVTSLTKKLNDAVAKNADEKLAAFVNLLGDDQEALQEKAEQLGKKADAPQVPIVVPVEYENGPADYGINPDAEVTVILAVKGKVVANRAYSAGKFDKKAIDSILSDVPKILQ